jgi:hypothetical protein
MIDIWTVTRTALSGLGLPTAANQLIVATGADRPDAYLVYQQISDPAAQHADDRETIRRYRMQVTYYGRTGLAGMPNIEGAMIAAGFTRLAGRELPYNAETRHFGFAFDFNYLDAS